MEKIILIEALEKISSTIFQHNAPIDNESYPLLIYYFYSGLPKGEGKKHIGKEKFFTVKLYTETSSDSLRDDLEEVLCAIPNTFLRDEREGKEDDLFFYELDMHTFDYDK